MFWPTYESFTEWGEYLAISIPVTAMICASWWAFEIFVLASGYIGVKEQAAQAILQNLSVFVFMVPLGIQEATCSLVGNSVGANYV